ncbi:MAG: hypothetical protein KDA57_02465 [Planctomycetales bacterium]|nr:hypothetical protein [Planctomycetales bacterium]
MSQIDQAFIRAYAPDPEHVAPPQGAVLPMAAEPIPAPHFRIAGSADAYADTAAMQRELLAGSEFSGAERRPLSTFAAPGQAATATFEPVFEVDAFRWPENADCLLAAHSELLSPVVEQLLSASEEGQSMVGIAGLRSGVGCSMVLMCLARLLARTGKAVAIVDANFASGTLAKQLGLEFDTGWEDVLAGRVPLAEAVVSSIEDRIALLPLSGSDPAPGELLTSIQTSVSAGVLRYHYDLVLFDLGTPDEGAQFEVVRKLLEYCRIDASILVADTAATDGEFTQAVDQLMKLLGPTCLGLIGNASASLTS